MKFHLRSDHSIGAMPDCAAGAAFVHPQCPHHHLRLGRYHDLGSSSGRRARLVEESAQTSSGWRILTHPNHRVAACGLKAALTGTTSSSTKVVLPAAKGFGSDTSSKEIWGIVCSTASALRTEGMAAQVAPTALLVTVAVGAVFAMIAAGVIAAFASALSRRMGWGPLPWQRSSSLGESKANSTGGKASLGEMLLAKLRFWKRESSSIPSGWSVVVDKDNSVLQEWFFLLYHARTRTRIEVPSGSVGGVLVQTGPGGPIKRVWPDGDAYERFSLHTGSRLVEAVKRGEGQTAMQYALEYSKSLGMWSVDEGSHEGGIRLNNEATGEVMDLARDGTVQYVGMGRMGAKLDAKAWMPEVETVSAADVRASLGLAPPDKGSASTSTMGGSRGEGGKRRRNSNPGSHPKELVCPIGGQLMKDPVIAADGFSYEKTEIEAWLSKHKTSPSTGRPLPNMNLIPNLALKHLLSTFQDV